MGKNGLLNKVVFTLCFLLFLGVTIEAQEKKFNVSKGSIDYIYNFPSKYVQERDVYIWLPDGYTRDSIYQVLYFHDGQMLFDSTQTWNKQEWKMDEIIGKLIDKDKIRPTIVVGIASISDKRHSEYFPEQPFEKLSDAEKEKIYAANRDENHMLFKYPIQSDNYLKFIVKELKPYIDSHYATHRKYQSTFIGGSSMGGLISWYAMCEYPKVFGGAICMSTHWPGIFELENNPIPEAFKKYLKRKLPSLKKHKIYFDYGNQTLDALYPELQQDIDSLTESNKYPENWKSMYFEGADHSEKSWAERLDIPLEYMLNPH